MRTAMNGGFTLRVMFVAVVAMMVACGGDSESEDPVAASTTTPPTTATSPTSASPAPTSTTPPGPPATRGPNAITFGPVTFHAPSDWGQASGGPTTAYIGVLAGGKGDVNLRVMTGYTGTVDALQPPFCLGAESLKAASVELIESGFAPVGSHTAEFRHWRFTCPDSDLKVEEHRVWLLPVSHIAIVEQRHAPEVDEVVSTAEVA